MREAEPVGEQESSQRGTESCRKRLAAAEEFLEKNWLGAYIHKGV